MQKRELLIEEALAKAWSVRSLARACRAAGGPRRARKTASGGLLGAITSSTTAAVESAMRDLDTLKEIAASGPTPVENAETVRLLLENCREAKERFAELEELATRLLDSPVQEAAE